MSRLLVGLLFLVLGTEVWSFSLNSQVLNVPGEGYMIMNVYTCSTDRTEPCLDLCGSDQQCTQRQSLCLNCVGANNLLLRNLFTRAPSYLGVLKEVSDLDLVAYLNNFSHVVVDSKSPYNFYRPWNSPEIRQQFLSFCPAGSEDAVFFVSLDGRGEPEMADYVMCKGSPQTRYYLLKKH